MSKNIILGVLAGVGLFALLIGLSWAGANKQMKGGSVELGRAEKIEVVHFHATQQCVSCITVGNFALKTIKERFPQEVAEGKIVFREVNGELPENAEMVTKYRATGSSLFVNVIYDGSDHIEEDTVVWRLVGNEKAFMDYFETKLKNILGK